VDRHREPRAIAEQAARVDDEPVALVGEQDLVEPARSRRPDLDRAADVA